MKLILLTYINRSGSTFLANLFSKSPDVLVCPEGEVLMNELLVKPETPFVLNDENRKRFLFFFKEDQKLKGWGLTEKVLGNLSVGESNFEVFVSILCSYRDNVKPGAEIILFKAERLIHLFDPLMSITLLDKVYFLSIIRDCRGVYSSQKRTKFPDSGNFMSRNPVQTSVNWNNHVHKALRLEKAGKMEMIKYEELILRTEEIFFRMLKKMEIPAFDVSKHNGDLFSRLLKSHKKVHRNILENPIHSKSEEWKFTLSVAEQGILEKLSGKMLGMLGLNAKDSGRSLLIYPLMGYYYFMYLSSKIYKKLQFLLKHQYM